LFVLFAFSGWSEVSTLSAEIRDGRRGMVRALVASIVTITALYLLANWALWRGLGMAGLAASRTPASDVIARAFGDWAGVLTAVAIAMATLPSINATIVVGARTTHAAATDWPALHRLGNWNRKAGHTGRPESFTGSRRDIGEGLGTYTRDGFITMVDYFRPGVLAVPDVEWLRRHRCGGATRNCHVRSACPVSVWLPSCSCLLPVRVVVEPRARTDLAHCLESPYSRSAASCFWVAPIGLDSAHAKQLPTILALATSLLAAAYAPAALGQGEDGWITHADAGSRTPIVLQFRRELRARPRAGEVAGQRDGRQSFHSLCERSRRPGVKEDDRVERLVAAQCDVICVDTAHGHSKNVIEAVVWNFGDFAPASQQIVATGFRLIGEPISTNAAGWRVRIDDSRTAINPKEQITWQYYVASTPEVIDARKINDEHWQDAVPAPAAACTLIVDPFPPQLFDG
jgi:hypothetical protein